tara:strand:+ start:156 stop:419 length:264 start_codon:yes stop_codon:yes gene_type:complete
MIKELKSLIYFFSIIFFIFFTLKYYFSDQNEKKLYRTLNNFDQKIENFTEKLPVLEDDTKNIIEYVEQKNTQKKKFNFWKLLEFDDK